MAEDDFESLPPPAYTLMADDPSFISALELSTDTPTPLTSRPRPTSVQTLPPSLYIQPTSPTSTSPPPMRYVYYQIFGRASTLSSKCAFDPEDDTIGRVPAKKIAPPRTAAIIKRYIAQLEGIDLSHVEAIYPNAESDVAIPDDTRISILEEGAPGTSQELPLAISLRDSDTPDGSASIDKLTGVSPVLLPTPILPSVTPPSATAPLPHVTFPPDVQLHPLQRSGSLSSSYSSNTVLSQPGASLSPPPPPPKPRWTIGEDGFAEPIESATEAGKVASNRQPPGWLSGRLQSIGQGIFMGKLGKKHGNVTTGGTVLRDGMRLWIDARRMRNLTLRTGDTFRTYRVIIPETRELTHLWTGDISIDSLQTQP